MIEHFEVLNLKAVERMAFHVKSNVLLLAGKCARGKSSVVDAAVALLGGGDAPPVRTGADEGRVKATLRGGFVAEIRVSPDGKKRLAVKKDDPVLGMVTLPKPVSVLDTLLGGIPVDVDTCLKMDEEKELVPLLLRLQGPEKAAELQALRDQEKAAYDGRKLASAKAKEKKAAADAIRVPDHIPTQAEIDAVQAEIDAGKRADQAHEDRVSAYLDMVEAVESAKDSVATTTEKLQAARVALAAAEAAHATAVNDQTVLENSLAATPDPRLTGYVGYAADELEAKKTDLVKRSGAAELVTQRDGLVEEFARYQKEATEFDGKVKAAREGIQHLFSGLECVRMDPLGAGLQGLNLNGAWEPLGDLSDSEKIITMAHILAAGGATFVRIKHGAELDDTQLANLRAVAERYPDTDFWVEVVRSEGDELVLEGADVEPGAVVGPVIVVEKGEIDVDAIKKEMADPTEIIHVEMDTAIPEPKPGDAKPDPAAGPVTVSVGFVDDTPAWARPGGQLPSESLDPPVDPNQKGLFE